MNLREWCNEHRFYPDQAQFVWDELARLMCADLDCSDSNNYQRYFNLTSVIGTHNCGSRELPVYSLERPEHGIRFVLRRTNDWKMSVVSERPVNVDLSTLTWVKRPTKAQQDYGDNPIRSAFMEGIPWDLCFGYYQENRKQFTLALSSDQKAWTAMFLILSALGVVPVVTHPTPPPKKKANDAP